MSDITVPIEYLLRFVEEDAPFGDATSEVIIPDCECHAIVRAEQAGIIAGISEALQIFSQYGIRAESPVKDGDRVKRGGTVLTITGNAKKILLLERTVLNIIGRMSGVATQTRKMADIIATKNPGCRVAGTRKTSPGFRLLDKKAIVLGGGDPHRFCLSDGVLIKDNHLALVSIPDAIRSVRKMTGYKKIEVEVESRPDALLAAEAGADIVMLDNMPPKEIRETLAALTSAGLRDRVLIELSGGIDEVSIGEFAALGADLISLGSLTHTVRNFSVNLEIVR